LIVVFLFLNFSFPLGTKVIEITASRIYGFPGLEVINEDKIEQIPLNTVEDILSYSSSLDIQKREPFSIQSDLTAKGSTFEQVLVLIDGVRVNNVQTNHHQLNIPLSKEDIKRIEILPVPASSVYGNGAYSGVINIVTKKKKYHHFSVGFNFYEKRTFSEVFSYGLNLRKWSWYFKEQRIRSHGYFDGRDFSVKNYFGKLNYSGKINFDMNFGFQKKDYGAEDFYSTILDDEREKTDSQFYFLNINIPLKRSLILKTKNYFQNTKDDFAYVYNGSSYLSSHKTQRYGSGFSINYIKEKFNSMFGFEYYMDKIESGSLGNENNKNNSLFFSVNFLQGVYKGGINLRTDKSSKFFRNNSVSVSLSFDSFLKPSFIFSTSYRTPSYTELKYWDPGNIGDKTLNIEKSRYLGVNLDFDYFKLSVFERREKDLIDWIKFTSTDSYHAYSVPDFKLYGLTLSRNFKSLKLSYSFLTDKKTEIDFYSSKYLMRYPEHQFNVFFYRNLRYFDLSAQGIYKKRKEEDGYFVLNLKLSKSLSNNIEVYFEGINILDTDYEDIKDVKQPGIWLGFGINFKI